ncbi:MAG TPA: SCP2 sterol-binding domain-containing protein [Acidimicrobiales bacterium]|nr:SCP2 sterol-binding domain-containing protein [Acidimicrobiales bacterium]
MPKDTQYVVTLSDEGALAVAPAEPGAAVVFTAAPADAEALAAGALDLNVAFMQGRVKAAGDMKALLDLLRRLQAR